MDERQEEMKEHVEDCILDAVTEARKYFLEKYGFIDHNLFREAVIAALELALNEYSLKGTIAGAKPE